MNAALELTHVTLTNRYGMSYDFRLLHQRDVIPTTPGLYAFVKIAKSSLGLVPPQIDVGYIGKAQNLRMRLVDHEVGPDARRWGMTHVAVLEAPFSTDDQRARTEAVLINSIDPPLNKQHRRVLRPVF